jgi:hypothetical protein
MADKEDLISHPKHYNSSKAKCECGRRIECIDIARHWDFRLGSALKYLWRHEHKEGLNSLKKAVWYIQDMIKEIESNVENEKSSGDEVS